MKKLSQSFACLLIIPLFFLYKAIHDYSWEQLAGLIPLWTLLIVLAAVIYSFTIHIVFHELGHLLFGKLTGYRLLFFQTLHFRYEARSRTFKRQKPPISGMLGQCMMAPPEKEDDEKRPSFWYLAGGLVINGLTGLLLYGGSLYFSGSWSLYSFLFSLPPLLLLMMNMVPVGYTDGKIIQETQKSPLTKKLFFKQLEIVALLEEGCAFEEIPPLYFEEVENGQAKESFLGEYLQLCNYKRKLARLDFVSADQQLKSVTSDSAYKNSAYAPILFGEKIFCDALFGRREEARRQWEEMKSIPQINRYYRNTKRIEAAYELFVEMDIEKAKQSLQKNSSVVMEEAMEAERRTEENLSEWLQSYFVNA